MEKSITELIVELRDPANRIGSGQGLGHFVYVLFKEEQVIYVGYTTHIWARLGKHISGIEFDSFSIAVVADKTQGFNLERELIQELNPLINKHRPTSKFIDQPEEVKQRRALEAQQRALERPEKHRKALAKLMHEHDERMAAEKGGSNASDDTDNRQ